MKHKKKALLICCPSSALGKGGPGGGGGGGITKFSFQKGEGLFLEEEGVYSTNIM